MTRRPFAALLAALLGASLLAACGNEPPPPAQQDAAPPAQQGKRPASIANFEGGASPASGTLPPGHPPLEGNAMPPVAAGAGGAELTWSLPEGWQEVPPSSSMRRAQFTVPGEAGPGELVVFYFGPGQGGDARSNAERWAAMFSQADGRSPLEAMKTEETATHGMKVLLVETQGAYRNSMAPMAGGGQAVPDHMLLGAIVEGPDANWFFKLTGPIATLEAQRQAFESFVSSIEVAAAG